jgi:hypothetical protein
MHAQEMLMRLSRRDLNHPRRRRHPGRWLLLATLVPLVAAGTVAFRLGTDALHGRNISVGLDAPIHMGAVKDLPAWALDVVHDLQLGADYQFVAAALDLNRDEQPEILLAPAPPRQDVFVPDTPLRVLVFENGQWQMDDTRLSCRPHRIGSFLTRDWWDLRCRTAQGSHVLRWTGYGYRVAKS